MKWFFFKRYQKIFTNLKFALGILGSIAMASALGSIIEQDEMPDFYQKNYPLEKPLYGFVHWKWILTLGLDHVYTTWWFFFLLLTLAVCLISCTISRQFPVFFQSKDFLFKKQKFSFFELPFFVIFPNVSYLKEFALCKIQQMNFYIYQKGNLIYGYQGLIGRISPILVHFVFQQETLLDFSTI